MMEWTDPPTKSPIDENRAFGISQRVLETSAFPSSSLSRERDTNARMEETVRTRRHRRHRRVLNLRRTTQKIEPKETERHTTRRSPLLRKYNTVHFFFISLPLSDLNFLDTCSSSFCFLLLLFIHRRLRTDETTPLLVQLFTVLDNLILPAPFALALSRY